MRWPSRQIVTRLLAPSALSLALATTTQAQNGPATTQSLEQQQAAEFAQASSEAGKLPAVKVSSIKELLHLTISSDMLSAELRNKPPATQVHIVLPNSSLVSVLQVFPSDDPAAGAELVRFMLMINDYSQPAPATANTHFSAVGGYVQLARDFENANVTGSVQLIQDPPPVPGQPVNPEGPVRLIVQRTSNSTGQDEVKLTLSAHTFTELARNHRDEIHQYLAPILHDLGQEDTILAPDAKSIWQVLGADVRSDAAVQKQVSGIVARMASDSFQDRRAAAASLDSLGQPAALVLMKLGRSSLTAEQNSGIDTFLASYLPLTAEDVKRLDGDVSFLLDCQYSSDIGARRLAAARLTKVVGHTIALDPDGSDDARSAAVLKLRESLLPATRPATTAP